MKKEQINCFINTNEEWNEMSWDDIHVMAEQAAGTEGRN